MLKVTEAARSRLLEMLWGRFSRESTLRLSIDDEGRLGLMIGKENKDDQIITYDGEPVLAIDNEVRHLLDGLTIDVTGFNGIARLGITRGSGEPAKSRRPGELAGIR